MRIAKIIIVLVLFANVMLSQDTIQMIEPNIDSSISLVDAYSNRESSRTFSEVAISDQTISNILWAANGVNRNKTGMRTAPSVMDMREVEIVICTEDGTFLYLPDTHALKVLSEVDVRSQIGAQECFQEAPITIIFIANYKKMEGFGDEYSQYFSTIDSGFVSQNIYLYCAAHGLGTVIIGSIDTDAVQQCLNLDEHLHIIMAQPIGHIVKE